VDRIPNKEAFERALRIFQQLETFDTRAMANGIDKDDFPFLHFSDKAQRFFD